MQVILFNSITLIYLICYHNSSIKQIGRLTTCVALQYTNCRIQDCTLVNDARPNL